MARPVLLFSLLSRLGARSVVPSVPVVGRRFASRGASRAWVGPSQVNRDRGSNRGSGPRNEPYEGDIELEDVEDKLQALMDEGRRRQKAVKYHILRRQMTPSGPPQRKLNWDAMMQIRYLKQEQPEEWTVERLAEGFSVTPDVILRVLRSKFVATPERKAKQDAKAMAGQGQQVLPSGAGTKQDRPKLPGNRTSALLTPGGREGAVVPVTDQTLMQRPVPVSALPASIRTVASRSAPVTRSTEEDSPSNMNPTDEDIEEWEEEEEECWDGYVFTDQELEEFMEKEKPSPVVKVGNEFLDAEGNFLYRI